MKQTVCDLCGDVLENGENMGTRSKVFEWMPEFRDVTVRVTTTVKIDGIPDPDVCESCVRRAVTEA